MQLPKQATGIKGRLLSLADEKNAEFQRRLTPGPSEDTFLGTRIPDLRKLAKSISNTDEASVFLQNLPHEYFDENMLHAILISGIKDFNDCLAKTKAFLPYIDNWAVCDSLSPVSFKKHKTELLGEIRLWASSEKTFTIRFGISMLMKHFLDDNFKIEYLQIPLAIKSDEYYVNMMIAWFYATALAKQWDNTLPILTSKSLPTWTHNKTIQKACESFRITQEQKGLLRMMKF